MADPVEQLEQTEQSPPAQSVEEQLANIDLFGERSETDAPETPDNEEPETENVESEAAPVEAETLDEPVNYDLDIPLPDHAEPVKLGELKDRFMEYHRRETELQKREADIASEYGTLAALNAEMQANKGPLTPEQRHRVGQMQTERLQREAELMSQAIPEWKEPAKFQSDKREIVEMMKPYGITEDAINGITDHRMALFFKHTLEMKRRIERAEQKVAQPEKPAKRPAGRRPGKTSGQARMDKLIQHAKESKNEGTKLAAIGALLGEK